MMESTNGRPIHLLFLLTSAAVGGAEMHTISLLNQLDPVRFRLSLAYLHDEHQLIEKIDKNRVNGAVFCCHVIRNIDWRAARRLRQFLSTAVRLDRALAVGPPGAHRRGVPFDLEPPAIPESEAADAGVRAPAAHHADARVRMREPAPPLATAADRGAR
jgi:hypothetical protein